MKLKIKVASSLLVGFLSLIIFAFTLGVHTVEAQDINATDTLNVSVTIAEKCIVDISPASLNWSQPLDPGSEGSNKTIQIENLGSVNLTHVWFNNSYPASRPFGTGLSTAYDSGNWMVIGNYTGGGQFYFPNRVEYNESSVIVYLTGPGSNQPPAVPYGRFRNSSFEYFWAVESGTTNYTDGDFYIGDTPHTQDQTGDADLSNNAPQGLTSLGDWGYRAITVNGMAICVAMYHDASKAMFYKFNMDAPGADSCSNAQYFINQSSDGAIVPGASGYARVAPYVPYGVVYNVTDPEITGTLTVIVSANG